MNNNTKSHEKVKKLVVMALLTALVVVLQTVASGIKIGTIPISLTLVPIVVGAILYGPLAGAFLGAVFGGVVAGAGLLGTDQFTAFLITIQPFWTIAIIFLKGILAGLLPGLVYKLFPKHRTIGCAAASAIAPIGNTGTFCISMLTVLKPSLLAVAGNTNAVYFLFVVMVGINFFIEIAVNVVLSTAVTRIVQTVSKQ